MGHNKSDTVYLFFTDFSQRGNFPWGNRPNTLPYAVLGMSAYLRARGFKVRIIDTRIEDYKKNDYSDALVFGLSTRTGPQIYNNLEISSFLKTISPHVPLIWGGIHPTLEPEQTINNPFVDIVVKGEGEVTLLELVQSIISDGKDWHNNLKDIKGIVFKSNSGETISTPDRDFMDLNNLPILQFFDIKIAKYDLSVFPLTTSRGCPYRCGFCYNLHFNKSRWRTMTAERMFEQTSLVVNEFGANTFIFEDDEPFVDPKRIYRFCQLVLEKGLKIRWQSPARANELRRYDTDFLELLKKSGCFRLWIGGESGNPEILKMIRKDNVPEDMIEAVRQCKKFDIEPILSFILGFPGETKKQMDDTLSFIDLLRKENKRTNVNGILIFTPFPGTPLYYKCKDLGVAFPNRLEDWGSYSFSDINNISYIEPKLLKRLTVINRISRFPIFQPKDDFYKINYNNRNLFKKIKLFLYFVFKVFLLHSGKFRWKHKWFSSAFEWYLWNWWYKKRMPTSV